MSFLIRPDFPSVRFFIRRGGGSSQLHLPPKSWFRPFRRPHAEASRLHTPPNQNNNSYNDIKDCLLGGGLSGSMGLTLRLAEAAGYTPLLITYKDIESSMKAVTR